jgi:hypothetical protein
MKMARLIDRRRHIPSFNGAIWFKDPNRLITRYL